MTPADRALRALEIQEYRTVVSYLDRPRRRSQVVPLDARRLHTIVDRTTYLQPRPSRLRQGVTFVARTLAWASLVVTGFLCLAFTVAVLWGVAQAFALGLRLLTGAFR